MLGDGRARLPAHGSDRGELDLPGRQPSLRARFHRADLQSRRLGLGAGERREFVIGEMVARFGPPVRRALAMSSRLRGGMSSGRVAARWRTTRQASSRHTDTCCVSRSAACTGREPRRRPSRTGRWTAQPAPENARRRRSSTDSEAPHSGRPLRRSVRTRSQPGRGGGRRRPARALVDES